jgi:hypothetical protein
VAWSNPQGKEADTALHANGIFWASANGMLTSATLDTVQHTGAAQLPPTSQHTNLQTAMTARGRFFVQCAFLGMVPLLHVRLAHIPGFRVFDDSRSSQDK